MRKVIYASQRVDVITSYGERRDALDQCWTDLFYKLGAILQPLPNHPETIRQLLERMPPDGLLLTGGNTPSAYGGQAAERDETDALLLTFAGEKNIPLLGVCRGMQSLILFYGGSLRQIDGHVAVMHEVSGKLPYNPVNSYHNYAIGRLPESFEVLARASDGSIEAVRHNQFPQMGMMWHPERENPFRQADIRIISDFFELEEGKI